MASQTHNSAEDARQGARMPMFTLKPSKQTCIILIGLIALGALGGVGLYVWQSGEMAGIEHQVDAKRAQLAGGKIIAGRLVTTEAAYTETHKQLDSLESSVTAGEYVPTLLRQMEGLAKQEMLQVGAVRPKLEPAPQPPADKEARKKFVPWPYDKIHIDMEVRGGYWNVARFLNKLTTFPKIMAVESVQLQPGGDIRTGTSPQLTVNLKLNGFIFTNDGKRASGGPPAVTATPGSLSLDTARAAAVGLVPAPPRILGAIGAHATQSVPR